MTVNPIVNIFTGEKFAEKKKEHFEQNLPARLQNLERQLEVPFFFGAQPLYCDFNVYHVLSNTRLLEPTSLDGHPKVVAFMSAFESLPNVKEYLEKRPQCTAIGVKPMLAPVS